jgi:hypothetical protein
VSVTPLAVLPRAFHVAPNASQSAHNAWEARRARMQTRRANFARAERLSFPEVAALDPKFDPGPEYDPQ